MLTYCSFESNMVSAYHFNDAECLQRFSEYNWIFVESIYPCDSQYYVRGQFVAWPSAPTVYINAYHLYTGRFH